jgi:hypothetical protein
MPSISHTPTDRDKALWKRIALFALFAIWLGTGWIARDPWKPDEPIYLGILHGMLASGDWWSTHIGGLALEGETPFVHWLNAVITWLPRQLFPLHEAARFASIFWTATAALCIALAASRWSAGHISYLAAIIFFGCLGLYDRAHSYVPETALVTALAIAIYALSELPSRSGRATTLLTLAGVLAFMSHGMLGVALLVLPTFLLAFAPVFSMYRLTLFRAVGFTIVLCALLTIAYAQRSPDSFATWWDAGAGLKFEDRNRFAPQAYLTTLLWFAWPAWPIAIWTLILRGRGFAGGWERAEIVAPGLLLICTFVLLNVLADQRTIYTLFLLPPFAILAAFGVDTVRRTWYAMIDWFGILVLGIASIGVFLVSFALYKKWPPNLANWAEKFVPNFSGELPWLGYIVALLAFLIWIALVQPAHQHARRALINWTGCVTFLWVVAQALLLVPANYVSSHRGVLTALNAFWPTSGCVDAIDVPPSHVAMLDYMIARRVEPIESISDATCKHLLIVRNRGDANPPDLSGYQTLFSGARPGDRSEKIELLRRIAATTESKL